MARPFLPIPPNFKVEDLLNRPDSNFMPVNRISATSINKLNATALDHLIYQELIINGRPLVIEDWHLRSDWPKHILNTRWLLNNHGQDQIAVTDLIAKEKERNNTASKEKLRPMFFTLGHYLNNTTKLACKFTPNSYMNGPGKQRLYAKDLDFPPIWRDYLSRLLPKSTFYLSPLSDLMAELPPDARAINMMMYIGHEGTYTPAHKEMCASIGHNIMVATEKDASAIWFMTETKDRSAFAEYWTNALGHDIEIEDYLASVEEWANAPFTTYVVEQKVGDYVLVPPAAAHQVWNRGEMTVKLAWNRITPETVEMALSEAVMKMKFVCRDEQYKIKSILHLTLLKYADILEGVVQSSSTDTSTIKRDFSRLYHLFDQVLIDEYFSLDHPEPDTTRIPNEYNVVCAYCRGNIFNRFLTCKRCVVAEVDEHGQETEELDFYEVCIDCYTLGRGCKCVAGLRWVEQYDWNLLVAQHNRFRALMEQIGGNRPKSLIEGVKSLGRKTHARVCQELLLALPIRDIKHDETPAQEGDVAKKGAVDGKNCHSCRHTHELYMFPLCTSRGCKKYYCFGTLWRGFDESPQSILSQFNWKCPFCRRICPCGPCSRSSKEMNPYHPTTLKLGYRTKEYTDNRSFEFLLSYSATNRGWLRGDPSKKRRRESGSGLDNEGDPEDDGPPNGGPPNGGPSGGGPPSGASPPGGPWSGSFGNASPSNGEGGSFNDTNIDPSLVSNGSPSGYTANSVGGGEHNLSSARVGARGGDPPSSISGRGSTSINLLASQLSRMGSTASRQSEVGAFRREGSGVGFSEISSSHVSPSPVDMHIGTPAITSLANNVLNRGYSVTNDDQLHTSLSQLEMDPQAFRIAAGLSLPSEPSLESPILPKLVSGTSSVDEPIPAPQVGWVRKAKLAKTRIDNLKGGRERRRSLVVELRYPSDQWMNSLVVPDLEVAEPSAQASLAGEDAAAQPTAQSDARPDHTDDEVDEEEPAEKGDTEYAAGRARPNARRNSMPSEIHAAIRTRPRARRSDILPSKAFTCGLEQLSDSLAHDGKQLRVSCERVPVTNLPDKIEVETEGLQKLIPPKWSFAVVIPKRSSSSKPSSSPIIIISSSAKLTSARIAKTRRRRSTLTPKTAQKDSEFKISRWSKLLVEDKTTIKGTNGIKLRPVASRKLSRQPPIILDDSEEEEVMRPPSSDDGIGSPCSSGEGEVDELEITNEEDEYNRRWSRIGRV